MGRAGRSRTAALSPPLLSGRARSRSLSMPQPHLPQSNNLISAHSCAFAMTDLFAWLAAAAETQRSAAAASGSRRRSASALHCRPLAAQSEPIAMRPSPVASSLSEPAVAWRSWQRLPIVEFWCSGSSRLPGASPAAAELEPFRVAPLRWPSDHPPACCSSSPALCTRSCVRVRERGQPSAADQ